MSADRMELNALSGLNLTLISTEVQSAFSAKKIANNFETDWYMMVLHAPLLSLMSLDKITLLAQ